MVHELVHVWQYQNGADVVGQFFKLREVFNGDYSLAYNVAPEDLLLDFSDLNQEQQAMLVQDLFRLREQAEPYISWLTEDKAEALMASAFG